MLREMHGTLHALGAEESIGVGGKRLEEFREAWWNNNLEWLHQELLKVPNYAEALACLKEGKTLKTRYADPINMGRMLGFVAYSSFHVGSFVGDGAVTASDLESAFSKWLPHKGDSLGTDMLVAYAERDLNLTPYRFEKAVELWWKGQSDPTFGGREGGQVQKSKNTEVVILNAQGCTFKKVSPTTLTFGYRGVQRFIERVV